MAQEQPVQEPLWSGWSAAPSALGFGPRGPASVPSSPMFPFHCIIEEMSLKIKKTPLCSIGCFGWPLNYLLLTNLTWLRIFSFLSLAIKKKSKSNICQVPDTQLCSTPHHLLDCYAPTICTLYDKLGAALHISTNSGFICYLCHRPWITIPIRWLWYDL